MPRGGGGGGGGGEWHHRETERRGVRSMLQDSAPWRPPPVHRPRSRPSRRRSPPLRLPLDPRVPLAAATAAAAVAAAPLGVAASAGDAVSSRIIASPSDPALPPPTRAPPPSPPSSSPPLSPSPSPFSSVQFSSVGPAGLSIHATSPQQQKVPLDSGRWNAQLGFASNPRPAVSARARDGRRRLIAERDRWANAGRQPSIHRHAALHGGGPCAAPCQRRQRGTLSAEARRRRRCRGGHRLSARFSGRRRRIRPQIRRPC